jgi:ComF family protein
MAHVRTIGKFRLAGRPAATVARGALDLLLPPRCLRCGEIVSGSDTVCAPCWSHLRFIDRPLCDGCGVPFDIGGDIGGDIGRRSEGEDEPESDGEGEGAGDGGSRCGACLHEPKPFARARSAIVYDDHSRGLVLMFKHGDRTDAVPVFAGWMIRAGAPLLAQADVLVPVPLHWTRLWRRRFNQAALLAHAISRRTGVPTVADALKRDRRTPKLGHLGAAARAETMRGAVRVHPRRVEALAGRRVLLIDDVLTTSSTVGACTRALADAGVAAVDVLTLARAVRPART